MAYSSGDTDKDDASQVARIMNFAIFIVRIFLRGNVTRQKRSNAIAVNFKIEHDTVESEMKLADLHTITPTTPSNQWYLPVICLVSLPGMLQTIIKISAAAMFMIRRYVIVLNRVFLFTVHISRRLPIMETKMITAYPIMLMTFSTEFSISVLQESLDIILGTFSVLFPVLFTALFRPFYASNAMLVCSGVRIKGW